MATEVHVHRLGEAYKRKEDARFIRGQGQYVDDVQSVSYTHLTLPTILRV